MFILREIVHWKENTDEVGNSKNNDNIILEHLEGTELDA